MHQESGSMADWDRDVPTAVIARLPALLRVLDAAVGRGDRTVSSDDLARGIGIGGAMVRKDLSLLGLSGTRGVGYEAAGLRCQIADVLGLYADRPVAIAGMGHLGRALAAYTGFAEQGFRIAAAFDTDPSVVGTVVRRVGTASLHVVDAAQMEPVIAREGIRMAILAVPAAAAQAVAERLVTAGVVSLLNFAPISLDLPPHVRVRRTDLAAELQILAFHVRQAGAAQLDVMA
jgi:redox-sensing transcriptional repressor